MQSKTNFWVRLKSIITQDPVMAGITGTFLIFLIQSTLGGQITASLKAMGIANPTNELVALIGLVVSAFVYVPSLYVIDIVNQKKLLLKIQVDQLKEEGKLLRAELEKLKETNRLLQIPNNVGLVRIYENFDFAKEAIRACLLNKDSPAQEISILIHCGANLIDGGNSILGDTLEELAQKKDRRLPEKIRILYSAIKSPYYTDCQYLKGRAESRNKDIDDPHWSKDSYIAQLISRFQGRTTTIKASIDRLRSYNLKVEFRDHNEPYLWNLIIVDGQVFVQGDIYKASLGKAPIMVFQDFNSKSANISKTYYYTFKKYFDDIWNYKSRSITP